MKLKKTVFFVLLWSSFTFNQVNAEPDIPNLNENHNIGINSFFGTDMRF